MSNKNRKKNLPSFLKAILWSYDIKKLEIEKDKRIIIESILSYGGDREIKWLLKTYTKAEIVSFIKQPSRGFWDEKSFIFWCEIFNIKFGKKGYEKAIKKIYPVS